MRVPTRTFYDPGDGTQDIIDRLSLSDRVKHYTSGSQGLRSVSDYFAWLETSLLNHEGETIGTMRYTPFHGSKIIAAELYDRERGKHSYSCWPQYC